MRHGCWNKGKTNKVKQANSVQRKFDENSTKNERSRNINRKCKQAHTKM